MENKIEYGKKSITEVKDDKLIETTDNIVAGEFVSPRKIHTEENIKIFNRADQDKEYISFADEEQRLFESGVLIEAEFQIRRTPASSKNGARYAIKKFTFFDSGLYQ